MINTQNRINNENSFVSDTNRHRERYIFGNPLSQEEDINKLSVQRIPSAPPIYSSDLEFQICSQVSDYTDGIIITDENDAFPIPTAVAYPTDV